MKAAKRHRSDLFVFVLAALLAGLLGTGCDRNGGDHPPDSMADSRAASFVWPEDPQHPMLRFEIEGAAGPGTIEVELMPELAPNTVAQIIEWTKQGYYDGTTFHRVIEGFMIQGGDPNTRDRIVQNDGQGGPGFSLDDEFSEAPFVRGVVGMGNTGRPNSAGSQFFITQADAPHLDVAYTVIGRVRSGMEHVDAIVEVEIDRVGRWGPANRPIEDVVLKRVQLIDPEPSPSAAVAASTDGAEARAAQPTRHTPVEEHSAQKRKAEDGHASPAAPAP